MGSPTSALPGAIEGCIAGIGLGEAPGVGGTSGVGGTGSSGIGSGSPGVGGTGSGVEGTVGSPGKAPSLLDMIRGRGPAGGAGGQAGGIISFPAHQIL